MLLLTHGTGEHRSSDLDKFAHKCFNKCGEANISLSKHRFARRAVKVWWIFLEQIEPSSEARDDSVVLNVKMRRLSKP